MVTTVNLPETPQAFPRDEISSKAPIKKMLNRPFNRHRNLTVRTAPQGQLPGAQTNKAQKSKGKKRERGRAREKDKERDTKKVTQRIGTSRPRYQFSFCARVGVGCRRMDSGGPATQPEMAQP